MSTARGSGARRPAPPVVESPADAVRALARARLRIGLRAAAVAAAGAMGLAAGLAGWAGLAGAAVGVALGFLSALATLGLMRLAAGLPVSALFGAVLGGYAVKVFLLLAVAVPLRGVSQLHPVALGLAVVAVVAAWAVADVVAFRRTPIPTVVPAPE